MITDEQKNLLRAALGLSFYVKKPTRNWLNNIAGHEDAVADLISRDYMVERHTHGPAGKEPFYEVTDAGVALVTGAGS